jgi:hypothetical protein
MLPQKISDVVAALNLGEQPAHQLGRQHASQSTYIYRVPQCMSPRRNWDCLRVSG